MQQVWSVGIRNIYTRIQQAHQDGWRIVSICPQHPTPVIPNAPQPFGKLDDCYIVIVEK